MMLQVFFALFMGAMAVSQAQTFFPDISKAKSAIVRVFGIVDRKPKINSSDDQKGRVNPCCISVPYVFRVYMITTKPCLLFTKSCLLPSKTLSTRHRRVYIRYGLTSSKVRLCKPDRVDNLSRTPSSHNLLDQLLISHAIITYGTKFNV